MSTEYTAAAALGATGDLALLRLLQITSANFPIGVFAYSQGLEGAVEQGWVRDPETLRVWLSGLLSSNFARVEIPLLLRAHRAWQDDQRAAVLHTCRLAHAFRESRELLEEDRHLGSALARMLHSLGVERAAPFIGDTQASYVCLYALAAVEWDIPLDRAAAAFAFSWLENQVLAASRLLPLGQTASQNVLARLLPEIPAATEAGLALPDEEIGALAPAFALATAWHETQYSRLFRS